MEWKHLAIAFFVLATALALTACSTPNSNVIRESVDEPIRIGALAPLTGDVAVYGQYIQRGLEMAQEDLAAQGWDVELVYGDTQCSGQGAATEMNKLVYYEKLPVVIGATCSAGTLGAAPIAEETGTVLLTPVSTAAAITDAGDYIFRLISKDDRQARDMAHYAHEQGYETAAVLYRNDDWGMGLATGFTDSFSDDGTVIISEKMEPSTRDVRAQLLKILEKKPDVIFAPCYVTECVAIIQQSKELGIDLPLLSADVFYTQDILDAVGPAADGVVYTFPTEPTGAAWESFRARFVERYGEEPTIFSATAYDSLFAIYYAADGKRAFTGEDVKDALYSIEFTGPSGHNAFDRNGDVDKGFSFGTVAGGEFVPLD